MLKKSYKKENLKYQLKRGMMNLIYQADRILHQIFKIILRISEKNMKKRLIALQQKKPK